ncbi:hypothetical protein ACLB2K_053490 [Fragaria x ananassa]
MREEEDDPHTLLVPHHQEDAYLIERTWLESKKLWQVAAPSIFSRLAMFSVTVVTQSFAGHLSDLDLAAISIATTVIIAITFGFMLGMASALETLCGQAYGAKQYHMLGTYMQRSWVVLFLCAVLLLPLFVFATPLLKLMGQPERFLQSQRKSGVIAWVSGGVLALHVFVSWLFVYGLRIGIGGTALTIGLAWWLSVLGFYVYTVCGGCKETWTGFSSEAFVGLWDFFKLSLASGFMLLLENIYFRALVIVSGYMHNTEIAVDALSICISIYAWESMIPLGFLAAVGVRVANELGASNTKGAKFATSVAVLTSLAVGLLFSLIIIAFHEKLAMIFISSIPVVTMANDLSVLLAFTILLNSIQPALSGVAIGSGRQAIVAIVNIGSYYLVGMPAGVVLGWLLMFGIKGLWAGMISGTVVQTLILMIITMRCDWEKEAERAHIHITKDAATPLIFSQ